MKVKTLFMLILLIGMMLPYGSVGQGIHVPTVSGKAVGVLVSDGSVPQLAYQTFHNNLPSGVQIQTFTTLYQALGANIPLFIFAHGDKSGLTLNGVHHSYTELISLKTTSQLVYLVACDSLSIRNLSGGQLFDGFNGKVDAVVAGLLAAVVVMKIIHDFSLIFSVMYKVINRIMALQSGAVAKYLAISESGYQIAYKKEFRSASVWGVTYYAEHYLWFNFDNGQCNTYFNPFAWGLILALFRSFLISQLVRAGIAAVLAGNLASLLATYIGLHIALILIGMNNRRLRDCKFGFGAQTLPLVSLNFHSDFGYNDGGIDGDQYIMHTLPTDALYAEALFGALYLFPSGWIPVMR